MKNKFFFTAPPRHSSIKLDSALGLIAAVRVESGELKNTHYSPLTTHYLFELLLEPLATSVLLLEVEPVANLVVEGQLLW